MVVSIQISIDTPERGIILTGTTIKGNASYTLDKDTVFNVISLSLICKTKCAWKERRRTSDRLVTSPQVLKCSAKENNTIQKIYFIQKENTDRMPLKVGTYVHSFQFYLSPNMSPSFKNEQSEIKYILQLKFKKACLFSLHKTFTYPLQVFPCIPVTITDNPVVVSLNKCLAKLFSNKIRKINVDVTVEKGFIVPCEDINITFVVVNESDILPSIKTELISVTTFKDHENHTNVEEKVIGGCITKTPHVNPDSIANMHTKITALPDMYTVRHSKIVTREFKLKFTLRLPLPHVNTSVEVPVFIGERLSYVEEQLVKIKDTDAPPTYWEAINSSGDQIARTKSEDVLDWIE